MIDNTPNLDGGKVTESMIADGALEPPWLKAYNPVKRESVSIVAMGMSGATYTRLVANTGSRYRVSDQTWAINSMGGVIDHDLLFHMDDCKLQEARAKRNPDGNVAGMLTWLKDHPKFFTSRAYQDYPGAIEYPLQEIANYVGSVYFNNTVPYAVAYAIYLGFKEIGLYGCDYSYENAHKSESGRGCVEHLLGIAQARGHHIKIASDSSLMDSNVPDAYKPYGYDAYDVDFDYQENGVTIIKTLRDKLPTPEEIEVRYNHE